MPRGGSGETAGKEMIMKAYNPYKEEMTEGDGDWSAFDHRIGLSVKSGFATPFEARTWIKENYPEDANGVTPNVKAEWMPINLEE